MSEMETTDGGSSQAADLRRMAEQRLQARETGAAEAVSESDVRALLHELQVHQIELEKRADELATANQALQFEIAARRQSEEALCESEAKFHAAFDNAPFEFWVRDAEGRRIMQNDAFTKHWGDQIGRRIEDADVPEEVAAVWQTNTRRAFAGEVVEGEVEYLCAGQRRVFHHVIAPFRVEGEIRGILGFNIDITARKRAENALKELNETLEQRVAERTEAIQMLHDVASMANESQSAPYAIEKCLHWLKRYYGWKFGHVAAAGHRQSG